MMAKKKKGNSKVQSAASKALAALEALEGNVAVPDGLGVAVPEPVKKKAKKDKAKDPFATADDDPFAVPIPDGMAPAVPEPIK